MLIRILKAAERCAKRQIRNRQERHDQADYVSAIARKSQGGGHRSAAGFSSDLSVDELTEFIVREVAAQVGAPAR